MKISISIFQIAAKSSLVFALTLAAIALVGGNGARADSCWNHNGSLMRLQASGNKRWFYYENPRQVLRNAGVQAGTLFFDGLKDGDTYVGTARRFSKFCPGTPLEYSVSGPVRSDQLEVTVFGQYEVFARCQATGRYKNDRLVFTYVSDC